MISNNFTFAVISSEEDYQESRKFIDKLPNHFKKVIVVTIKGAKTERVECQDPFIEIYKWGYEEFSFSKARNFARNMANTEWLISLDMDEEFYYTNDDLERIVKAPKEIGGFLVPIMNFDVTGHLLKQHLAIRIFRKRFEWRFNVHEDLSRDINEKGFQIAETPIVIRHFGYDNVNSEKYYSKLKRNYDLCIKDCVENPTDEYVRNNMNRITNDMRRWENDN